MTSSISKIFKSQIVYDLPFLLVQYLKFYVYSAVVLYFALVLLTCYMCL